MGYRAVDCPTRWGLPPNFDNDECTRCGRREHKTKWCVIKKGAPPTKTRPEKQNQNKMAGGPYKKESYEVLGMWSGWLLCRKFPNGKVLVLWGVRTPEEKLPA